MKPGTPGFVGARLREAREARGLTAVALAEIVGVTRQAVSQYEIGAGSPRPEILRKMSEVLNVPEHRFVRPVEQRASHAVFFRSMSAATKAARSRSERRYRWLEEIVGYQERVVEFPAINFPDFQPPNDASALGSSDIEHLATETRRFWGMRDDPINNMVWLLENHGAIVTRDDLGAETLDAYSGFVGERPFIVLGSEKGSALRSRFDAAHELGHLILHRHIDPARLSSSVELKRVETQAHWFAGAFLLPATSFIQDLYSLTLDTFKVLSSKWKVSMGAMIKRVENLDLFSEDQLHRLWIQRSRRGYHKREPLDDLLPVETPRVLARATELCIKESGAAKVFVHDIALSSTDIAALCHVAPEMLDSRPIEILDPRVHVLRIGERSKKPSAARTGPAEVRQFHKKS